MTLVAAQFGPDLAAARMVSHLDACRPEPAVAPFHEGSEGREEVRAHLRQSVFHPGPLAGFPVGPPFEQPHLHQLLEPGRRHRLTDPYAVCEVIEPGGP